MGTRSLIHVKDEDGKTLVTIYRQFDGYPTGMGADIKAVFDGKTLVNGYSDPETQVNGMGCAAAMLIAAIKNGCGGVYIQPPEDKGCWEAFTYTLYQSADMHLSLKVVAHEEILFDGLLADFDPEKADNAV